MEQQLAERPLEHNLGFLDFTKYTSAPKEATHAYEKIGDIWNEEVEEDSSDEEASDDKTPTNTNNTADMVLVAYLSLSFF